MITAEQLQTILNFQPDHIPITTLYLSFDEQAKKQKEHKILLKDFFRYKTEKSYFKNLESEAKDSVREDFDRIEEYINMEYGQGEQSKSLAIYSCSGEDLWETLQFDVPLETSMVINPHPYLRPLVEAASEHRNYAIILVDRAKAAILEIRLGRVIEHMRVREDDMPDQVKEGDFGGTSERRIERHINDHVRQHLKNIADKAMELQQAHDYKWVYIGGRREIINEFEDLLHSYVRERIQDHIVIEPHAPMDEVLERASQAEENARMEYEKRRLRNLSDEIGARQRGLAGLEPILKSQVRGQVETLLVQEDFSRKGYYCKECYFLTENEETEECPVDGSTLYRTPDVVDNLIYNVLKQGGGAEAISQSMEDFSGIGAFLRYPIQQT
mgnify:CR=1 FL=1